MTHQVNYNEYHPAVEALMSQGFEGMAGAIQLLLNEAMKIERAETLNALPYERT